MKSIQVSSGQLATAEQYNNLRQDAEYSSYLAVTADTPNSNTVTLNGGNFQNSIFNIVTIGNIAVTGIVFPTTPGEQQYLLISIDDSGNAVKTYGASAVTAVKPLRPANTLPCGYILLSQGQTTVAQSDIEDARAVGSGTSTGVDSDITLTPGADIVANIISLTTAEYEAITPDADTIYNITDDSQTGVSYVTLNGTDVLTNKTVNGVVLNNTGPASNSLREDGTYVSVGVLSGTALPDAAVNIFRQYFRTDEDILYISNGTTWLALN